MFENLEEFSKELESILKVNKELNEEVEKLSAEKYNAQVVEPTNDFMFDKPIKLYQPVPKFTIGTKCNKCNKDRLIVEDETFAFRFSVCSCAAPKKEYSVLGHNVVYVETSGKSLLYVLENDPKRFVNKDYVFNNFSSKQLDLDSDCVYYTNEEDCKEYCRRKIR